MSNHKKPVRRGKTAQPRLGSVVSSGIFVIVFKVLETNSNDNSNNQSSDTTTNSVLDFIGLKFEINSEIVLTKKYDH